MEDGRSSRRLAERAHCAGKRSLRDVSLLCVAGRLIQWMFALMRLDEG